MRTGNPLIDALPTEPSGVGMQMPTPRRADAETLREWHASVARSRAWIEKEYDTPWESLFPVDKGPA